MFEACRSYLACMLFAPDACGWRIVNSHMIPRDSPSCYDSAMRNLVVLFIHFIATLARLLGPRGVHSLVAESLLLKHQLLIVNRSRHRSPNLSAWDRILAGLLALSVRPTRLLRSAIVLKPSTLLALHKAMSKRKYRMLFSPNRHRKPGPKGPSAELIQVVKCPQMLFPDHQGSRQKDNRQDTRICVHRAL